MAKEDVREVEALSEVLLKMHLDYDTMAAEQETAAEQMAQLAQEAIELREILDSAESGLRGLVVESEMDATDGSAHTSACLARLNDLHTDCMAMVDTFKQCKDMLRVTESKLSKGSSTMFLKIADQLRSLMDLEENVIQLEQALHNPNQGGKENVNDDQ